MASETNRESDKFLVRLPDGMRDRIRAAADRNIRSMNAEIVHSLEVYFAGEAAGVDRAADLIIEAVRARLGGV